MSTPDDSEKTFVVRPGAGGQPAGGWAAPPAGDWSAAPRPSAWSAPPPPPPPPQSPAWGSRPAAPPPEAAVRHRYPLAVRDHGLATAIGLLMRSMPYALARFGLELAYAVAGIIWIVVAFGGAAWLSTHIAGAFGVAWLLVCLVGVGWFWGAVLRYLLNVIECGHVAVLTEFITKGQLPPDSGSMFAYGKKLVTDRFLQVNAIYGLNLAVRGVLGAFHRTLDYIGELLPIPGLDALSNLVNLVLRSATRYLDKVVFSYILARNDGEPWRDAREGIIYYAQNAKPILMTSVWIIVLEKVLTFVAWLVLMAPAALITVMLPQGVRESAGIVTVLVAALLAATVRSSFIKPIFLIMMMVRYHALIEGQPINAGWDEQLSNISGKFRDLGTQAVAAARA